jgi:hypothetical protein
MKQEKAKKTPEKRKNRAIIRGPKGKYLWPGIAIIILGGAILSIAGVGGSGEAATILLIIGACMMAVIGPTAMLIGWWYSMSVYFRNERAKQEQRKNVEYKRKRNAAMNSLQRDSSEKVLGEAVHHTDESTDGDEMAAYRIL